MIYQIVDGCLETKNVDCL